MVWVRNMDNKTLDRLDPIKTPPRKTVKVDFRVPPEVKEALKSLARKKGKTQNALGVHALVELIRRN